MSLIKCNTHATSTHLFDPIEETHCSPSEIKILKVALKVLFAPLPYRKIDPCTQVETLEDRNIETVTWRMLASLDIAEPEKVVSTVGQILLGFSTEQGTKITFYYLLKEPLSKFPPNRVTQVFTEYGLSCTPEEKKRVLFGTVLNLVEYIINEKKEGLNPQQYYEMMISLLRGLLRKKGVPKEEEQLLKQYLDRTCYANQQLIQWGKLYYLHYQSLTEPRNMKEYKKTLSQFAAEQVNRIDKIEGQQVGNIILSGWPGHYIGLEIRRENEEYICSVANAGLGQKRHHYQIEKNQNQSINIYTLPTKDALHSFLEKLLDFRIRGGGESATHEELAKQYYHLFDGSMRKIYLGLPARPPQTVGNCGLRNQEELFFWVCQRTNQTHLASAFQEHVKETCQKECNHYPQLEKEVAKAENKPPVTPLAHLNIKTLVA